MSDDWMETTLGDAPLQIIDGDRGNAYPKQNDFLEDGHCLFLNTANVTISGFQFSSCQFVSEQKDFELRKGKLARDDVILTTRGTLGNTALYNDNVPYDHVRINSGMVLIRANKEKLLPSFIYAFLRSASFKDEVEQFRSGVAQPQLPIRDLRKIKIKFPGKDTQERIIDMVSAYDDLIENNTRQIQLLEEAARQLYKEWFVRRRFPGHEQVKTVDGLPEGWKKIRIDEFGSVITGKTPSTKVENYYGGEVLFVKTPDMHGNVFVTETGAKLTEDGANSQSGKYVPAGSTLVSCIGTLGVVSLASEVCQFNQQINAIVPGKEYYRYYCYFAMKNIKPILEGLSGGVTMANVSKEKFSSIELLCPPKQSLTDFDEFCGPIFDQIIILAKQNQKLRQARDLLLPRLMSGEIRV